MKTMLRAILAGVFLVISLVVILVSPLPGFLASLLEPFVASLSRSTLFQGVTAIGLAAFILVALAGVLSDVLVSLLVPMNSTRLRRLLHALGLACVFAVGLAVLGATEWLNSGGTSRLADGLSFIPGLAEFLGSGQLNLAVSWPFLAQAAIGFAGYLLVSLIVRPVSRQSRFLKTHMTKDEDVICNIHQTRWKHPVTPDSISATNRRVIVYRPTNLGFTSTVEDYNYIDIANIKIDRGLLFSSITLQSRFEGDDLVFHDIPKSRADAFARDVTEQLRAVRGQVPLSQPPAPKAGAG